MPAITTIKLRRGTAAQWTSTNPILAAGEMGIETDTQRSKFGNGTQAWTALPYTVGDSSGIGTIDWTAVLNKPTEFNPIAHAADHGFGGSDAITIEPSQVTGLNTFIGDVQATLPNKQDKVTGVSDTEIGYLDGVTSAIQTQLDGKAATVHTHVKTDITDFAHTHLLADITDYAVPDLNGLSDVVITDEATGQVLQWNGTTWVNATVDALPSQTGNNGKYLTTDGTTASWATITTDPTPTVFLLMGA